MVVVRIKVSMLANLFVLRLQKISVFWLIWLLISSSLRFVYLFVYSGLFFVVIILIIIRDLWLLVVYSSISNTGIILLRVFGSNYMRIVFLYLAVIFIIIYLSKKIESHMELLLLVFFFLVIPPFILFFIKFYVVLSLDFIIKLAFFLIVFDVLILIYYFSLIFMKFLIIEVGILIYFINLFLIFIILVLRNCVAMIIFNKS